MRGNSCILEDGFRIIARISIWDCIKYLQAASYSYYFTTFDNCFRLIRKYKYNLLDENYLCKKLFIIDIDFQNSILIKLYLKICSVI